MELTWVTGFNNSTGKKIHPVMAAKPKKTEWFTS